jgi:hypothetical protein
MTTSTSISIVIFINNVSITDPLCLLGCNPKPSVDLILYSIVSPYFVHSITMKLIAFMSD